ncbi:MAG: hypothetical protein EAZ42_09765 [Verrucomicrobia bacterium]|nr:MAG: hypothetical protein EAZ42_09765 [Verrucomicrobiota bacterium]
MVYPFTAQFAETQTEQARTMLAHNQKVLSLTEEIPADAAPAQLLEINASQLNAAVEKKINLGTKLIAYDYDAAFPMLLRKLMQPGITWFVLAAIFGAVVSSLASMLNSAATIATIDIYQKIQPKASQQALVNMGKFFTLLFVLIACVIAPGLGDPKFGGIFTFIQQFQGFISPGVLMIFLFGFLVPRAPRFVGWLGIVINVLLYGYLYLFHDEIPFLNRMAICFGAILLILSVITWIKPLAKPVEMPTTDLISLESSNSAKIGGIVVVALTLLLYVIFW